MWKLRSKPPKVVSDRDSYNASTNLLFSAKDQKEKGEIPNSRLSEIKVIALSALIGSCYDGSESDCCSDSARCSGSCRGH